MNCIKITIVIESPATEEMCMDCGQSFDLDALSMYGHGAYICDSCAHIAAKAEQLALLG